MEKYELKFENGRKCTIDCDSTKSFQDKINDAENRFNSECVMINDKPIKKHSVGGFLVGATIGAILGNSVPARTISKTASGVKKTANKLGRNVKKQVKKFAGGGGLDSLMVGDIVKVKLPNGFNGVVRIEPNDKNDGKFMGVPLRSTYKAKNDPSYLNSRQYFTKENIELIKDDFSNISHNDEIELDRYRKLKFSGGGSTDEDLRMTYGQLKEGSEYYNFDRFSNPQKVTITHKSIQGVSFGGDKVAGAFITAPYNSTFNETSKVPFYLNEKIINKVIANHHKKKLKEIQTKKYSGGGSTDEGIDLFEDYDNIPPQVQKILDKYADSFEDGDYKGLTDADNELNKIGYTFDFYLDGVAYDLRPIGSKGKSEISEFRGGGKTKTSRGNVPAIERKVKEVNRLIELANENELEVVDSRSTWESPMKYKPIRYSNGALYIEYMELDLYKYNRTGIANWVWQKEKVLKRDMEFDNPLNDIAKMYRKALKSANVMFDDGGITKPRFVIEVNEIGNWQNNWIEQYANDIDEARKKRDEIQERLGNDRWAVGLRPVKPNEFAEGGLSSLAMAGGNPEIAMAEQVTKVLPNTTSAIDKRIANQIYSEKKWYEDQSGGEHKYSKGGKTIAVIKAETELKRAKQSKISSWIDEASRKLDEAYAKDTKMYAEGGQVGDEITFTHWSGDTKTGTISEDLGNGNFEVQSGWGKVLVHKDDIISKGKKYSKGGLAYNDAIFEFNNELREQPFVLELAKNYNKTPIEIVKHLQPRISTKGNKSGKTTEVSIDFTDTNTNIQVKHRKKFSGGGSTDSFMPNGSVTLIFNGKKYDFPAEYIKQGDTLYLEDMDLISSLHSEELKGYLKREFYLWLENSNPEYEDMYFSEDAIYSVSGAIQGAIEIIDEELHEQWKSNRKAILDLDKQSDFIVGFE